MKVIEYFNPRLNGWLSLTLDNYLSLLFHTNKEKKFAKKRIPKGLPIRIIEPSSSKEEVALIPGNYVEVLIKKNLNLGINEKNGKIEINNEYKNRSEMKTYDVWTIGKIMTNDTNLKIILIEINEEIMVVDNTDKIRNLREIKLMENSLIAYNIKQINNNEYNTIKEEVEKKSEESNTLSYIKYDVINASLLCIVNKNEIKNMLTLKEYEEKYRRNNEEQNSISDISNPNSNNNLIGIRINNEANDIINFDEEIKNEINEYKYKCIFSYRDKFKKEIEKIINEMFQKCKYHVGKIIENNFEIVIFSNNEKDFNEEKNNFQKEYKQMRIDSDSLVDKNEVKDLAKKSNIKFIDIDKKNIYIVGADKNINNFIAVWDVTKDYSKEFQKKSKENEFIQKKLQTFQKKHKIKTK